VSIGSVIVIEYDGTDITDHVIFAETSFECQMAAIPGAFTAVVRDEDRSRTFVTGKELTLSVDGVLVYGGFVTSAQRTYAFPADKTADLTHVRSRKWVLTGVDYNILFDKRVLRNTSDYTHDIADVTGSPTDGSIIRTYFSTYFDIPAGFNFTSTTYILDNYTFDTTGKYTWDTQGVKMRDVMEDLAQYGSVYWISADKQLHFRPVQDQLADWGFSDKPTTADRIGFRSGEMIEDASSIANDALVWGGSAWASNGGIVFARRENSASQTAHKRWQIAENRVGDSNYKIQAEVDARAKIIVDGNASGVFAEGSQGLVNPEQQFRATWFGQDVPTSGGNRLHLLPGQVVPIDLWVFSEDGGTTPFQMDLPLRQVRITFPDADPSTSPSTSYVQFEGFFGVLMSDPYWLWSYLRSIVPTVSRKRATSIIATADNSTTAPVYGAYYSDEPSPITDGSTTVFTIPFSYIALTLRVFLNGAQKIRGTDYTESDPANGEFTMATPPSSSDKLWVIALLAG
jgi:hypothetical protein